MDPNSNPAELEKGDVDDSIILYIIILSIILIVIAVVIFGFILRTQRKKDVVGWDWMSAQDLDAGQATTLPGYEQQQQLPPPGVEPSPEPAAPSPELEAETEPGAVPMPAPAETPELPAVVGAESSPQPPAPSPDSEAETDAGEAGGYECPECGASIAETDTVCPSCNVEFE
jgi:hypothetical protein